MQCVCGMCVGAHGSQVRASDPLVLVLYVVVYVVEYMVLETSLRLS